MNVADFIIGLFAGLAAGIWFCAWVDRRCEKRMLRGNKNATE